MGRHRASSREHRSPELLCICVFNYLHIFVECFRIDSDDIAMGEALGNAVYHEKQSMMLCAIHAVNNLLQSNGAFTKKQFDEICCQ